MMPAMDPPECRWRYYAESPVSAGSPAVAPDGTVIADIAVPASRVTSCCFGGEKNHTLFITSARGETDPGYCEAGSVFTVELKTAGLPRHCSRLAAST